jgi:hypothetical protein
MLGERDQLNPSCGGDNLRRHELAAILLGQVLEPRGDMHGIADRRQQEAVAVAQLAEDHVPGVQANSHGDRPRQFVGHRPIHLGEAAVDELGRRKRLTAGLLRLGAYTEDRHHAVADELVRRSPGLDHRSGNGVEETIEQEQS